MFWDFHKRIWKEDRKPKSLEPNIKNEHIFLCKNLHLLLRYVQNTTHSKFLTDHSLDSRNNKVEQIETNYRIEVKDSITSWWLIQYPNLCVQDRLWKDPWVDRFEVHLRFDGSPVTKTVDKCSINWVGLHQQISQEVHEHLSLK